MSTAELWAFLPYGYLITISVELPILLLGLSRRHPVSHRVFAGLWLTACTYPIVILVLPPLFDLESQRGLYLIVAETFAPAAECVLFYVAFVRNREWDRRATIRDGVVIVAANLGSFGVGELLNVTGGWDWLRGMVS